MEEITSGMRGMDSNDNLNSSYTGKRLVGLFYLVDNVPCSVVQSCLTLCNPYGLQPTRVLCPWDFPGKNTRVEVRGRKYSSSLTYLQGQLQGLTTLSPELPLQDLVKIAPITS